MGLYDRDYVREQPQGFFLGGSRTMVTNLILINVGIFLVDIVFFNRSLSGPNGQGYLTLHENLFSHPWDFWQLLTYGFVHDAGNPGTPIMLGNFAHVGFNMFGLWLFGRDVESIYGPKEFLRIYLSLIVLCGLTWSILHTFLGSGGAVLGASGAVIGIMVLYVTHYPNRTFLIMGILPMPAWALCIFMYLLPNVAGFAGALRGNSEGVAYDVHLAGALFAFIYRRTGWNLGRMIPSRWSKVWRLPRSTRLKVHQPPADDEPDTSRREENLNRRVDEILAKISSTGEASLTREERRILEDASRRYQQRRR